MCSELFRIPLELGGIPLFGFGVLTAFWLVAGAWTLVRTAQSEGWATAAAMQLPMLALGTLFLSFLPRYFDQGVPIRGYGLMVLCGSIVGIGMAAARGQSKGVPQETIFALAMWLFVGGIVGARLFFVIEYWDTRISQRDVQGSVDWSATLKQALSYTEGGLVIYGAFFGAAAAFAAYVRRRGLPALALADLIAPSLLAGLACGRIGCLLNGCCYGGTADAPWGITFPRLNSPTTWSGPFQDHAEQGLFYGMRIGAEDDSGRPTVVQVRPQSPAALAKVVPGMVLAKINDQPVQTKIQAGAVLFAALERGSSLRLESIDGQRVELPSVSAPARSLPVHPTQIYSAVNAALLSWTLWSFYPLRRRDGEVVALMLTVYPVARFLLEIIRVDEAPVFSTRMSISQNISIVLFMGAICFWLRLARLPKQRADLNPSVPKTTRRPVLR